MERIPESYHDLFERKTFAHFTTLMPDGTPQTTPVWIDYDVEANRVLVNTARGRRKERNVRERPAVSVSMTDPDDGYRYVSVRGTVETVTTEGAIEQIDALARRYMDVEEYPHHGEEGGPRVQIRIRPDRVVAHGDE